MCHMAIQINSYCKLHDCIYDCEENAVTSGYLPLGDDQVSAAAIMRELSTREDESSSGSINSQC